MNTSSYTAASAFPIKIFSDDELVRQIREHRIPPIHIQHNITNKCPGKCSFCCAAGTMILTPKGSVPIENITVGMDVISAEKNIRKVTHVFKRTVKSALEIHIEGVPNIVVSREHPFMVDGKIVKANKLTKNMRLDMVRPAMNFNTLRKNGMRQGQTKRVLYISKLFKQSEKRYHSKRRFFSTPSEIGAFRIKNTKNPCPQKMRMDFDFGRFCGFFISEGHISTLKNRPNSKYICLSFGRTESEYINFIKRFCRKNGLISHTSFPSKSSIQIVVANSIFASVIERYFGTNCTSKRIPFELNPCYDFIKGLIRGIYDGDGHYARNYLNLVNKKLIFDIYHVLLAFGIRPIYWKRAGGKAKIEGRDIVAQESYCLGIRKKMWNVFRVFLEKGKRHWNYFIKREDSARITKIKRINRKTIVHNFSVDKDETYCANFIKSHNCSCRHRDRSLEMPLEQFKEITLLFKKLGTRACTFTGGGDPLAHPDINKILAYTLELGIEIGLVTEGTFLGKLEKGIARNIKWCRISVSDERPIVGSYADSLAEECEWGLSYVLTENPRYSHLFDAIGFANKNNMTHVRVATDILSDKADIWKAKAICEQAGIDTRLVIWQDRTAYCKGVKRCLISLMKPNITPDGHLVGCCGQQYSSIPPMLDWPRLMHMQGTIEEIFEKQAYYDGSQCQRCYYGTYNDVLNAVWDAAKIKHANFK